MKKTVAVIFGTFAPMHKGHIDLIQRAKRACDRAVVIVSGYENDRGDKIGLGLQKRFRYIRETFNDESLISVYKLDETGMPPYPEGWTPWLEALQQLVQAGEDEELVFYVSEKEYSAELEERGFRASFTERNFGISATLIRENPAKHWNLIAKPFRRHFSKNVLVVGSASNGKTTLVKDLGRYYSCPVSLEYARYYQKRYNVRDDELTGKDYNYLLTGQYRQTSDLIDSDTNRGLVIADTNATVTEAYYNYYIGESSSSFHSLCADTVKNEKWDLIIFVLPTGNYVDDGFRDMSMADQEVRHAFTELLKKLVAKNHPDAHLAFIGGSYLENYQKSIDLIDAIYQEF
ncbi:TPA: AAA family ATPase [Streptococcus suis]|uniref:AAA family ATPase n=1 Tax=Streptococcus TaxID=1301 RepID=UPI000CF4CB78|nr:AAA family ATPase [Streptococcus suis]NQG18653.1 AAA family ATPase [Streptococcus suis]NQI34118.1 AAA family ATPase [Streptococcus suis]NQL65384.1 AAA family ATPase [Streptococcus suis]NQM37435.1 AAA family ATPase [Streptococcus suis]NQP64258.1 AAA family ATPase [Streptococcus suis]